MSQPATRRFWRQYRGHAVAWHWPWKLRWLSWRWWAVPAWARCRDCSPRARAFGGDEITFEGAL